MIPAQATSQVDRCDMCGAAAPSALCDRCAPVFEATSRDPERTVEIPSGDDHDGIRVLRVTIPWVCPRCGGPRGEVFRTISFDGSRRLPCDGWSNACGHVDTYAAVRRGLSVTESSR